MKYYLIYEIRNLINNKIYIGMHITEDLNDNYMGSGSILKKAFKKYGIENFKKTILFNFSTFAEMVDKETELVDENFISHKDTYNVTKGGKGSFYYINSSGIGQLASFNGAVKRADKFGGMWYSNGTELKQFRSFDFIPDEWTKISSTQDFRNNQYGIDRIKGTGSGTKGRILYHNPKNPKEIVYLLPEESIPSGWVKGSGRNLNIRNNRFWFHYPETGEYGQFALGTQPEGWIRGRGKKKR